jgi:peroxiredoxin Q/BCP
MISEGQPAPNFQLPASDGTIYSLDSFKGKKNVILYFYPKDDTPGCTKEACGFRDRCADILQRGTVIFGISTDSVESHQAFVSKFQLNFPLLADKDGSVSKLYGAFNPEKGYDQRITVIIDITGKISKIFQKVNPENHSQEILAFI